MDPRQKVFYLNKNAMSHRAFESSDRVQTIGGQKVVFLRPVHPYPYDFATRLSSPVYALDMDPTVHPVQPDCPEPVQIQYWSFVAEKTEPLLVYPQYILLLS